MVAHRPVLANGHKFNPCLLDYYGLLVKRLRHGPFTAVTWVQFPHRSPLYAGLAQRQSSSFVTSRSRFRNSHSAPKIVNIFTIKKQQMQYFVAFLLWGYSSVGRASGLHPEGRRFKTCYSHHADNHLRYIWGYSSVGRAPALQAGGRGFESLYFHHYSSKKEV